MILVFRVDRMALLIRSLIRRGFVRSSSSRVSKMDELMAQEDKSNESDDVDAFMATLDDESRQRIESFIAEYEVFKYSDSRMPSKLAPKNLRRMLLMNSKTERIHYLTFLHQTEHLRLRIQLEKTAQQSVIQEYVEKKRAEIKRQMDEHIYYGVGGSALFRRILETDMVKNLNNRLINAMLYGPRLIIDMSFVHMLRPAESSQTTKQLFQLHHDNRSHRFPHHLVFTGCNRQHSSWEDLERFLDVSGSSRYYTVTEKHYLDLYPKEQLIILTPDSRQPVAEYDPDKVYIMGAIVDKTGRPNLTLGRAKEEGIEARRLPLERCIRLVGRKSLCLNHVVGILNDAHAFGSITFGILNNLPKRMTVPRSNPKTKTKREFSRQRIKYLESIGKT